MIWTKAPLGDLLTYAGKGIAPKYTDDSSAAGSVMVLGQKCVRNQSVIYTEARFHDEAAKSFKPEKIVCTGDILVNATGVGSAGRVAQVVDAPSRKCITDGHVITLRSSNRIDPIYLGYFVKSKQALIEKMAEGSTGQTEMNRTRLQNEILVTFPESNEDQKAIANYGLAIDRKIETNAKLNGYLEELADALFQQKFGLLRDNAVLADIVDITMGQSPAGSSYNEDGIGTIFYQGRAEFGWRYPTPRLYTTEPKRMAKAGDVLMSVRAPVGDLNLAYEDCCIGRGLAAIHCDHPSYGLYLMRSLHRKLDAYNGEGTVFGSINGKALKGLPVALSDDATICEFEKEAAPINAQIRSNETESRSLAALRDALLPKLMSGEIDVSKIDPMQLNSHLSKCSSGSCCILPVMAALPATK